MGSSATPSVNPIAAELEAARPQRTPKELMRRVRQRRQIQIMIAASYMVDGLVLLIYAHAGTVPVAIGPAFVLETEGIRMPRRFIDKAQVRNEIERLKDALAPGSALVISHGTRDFDPVVVQKQDGRTRHQRPAVICGSVTL